MVFYCRNFESAITISYRSVVMISKAALVIPYWNMKMLFDLFFTPMVWFTLVVGTGP